MNLWELTAKINYLQLNKSGKESVMMKQNCTVLKQGILLLLMWIKYLHSRVYFLCYPLVTDVCHVRVCLLCRSLQWQERKEHVLSDFNSQFWNSISPHPSQPMGEEHGHFLTHLNSSLGNFEVQWENLMATTLPMQEDKIVKTLSLLPSWIWFCSFTQHIYVWS